MLNTRDRANIMKIIPTWSRVSLPRFHQMAVQESWRAIWWNLPGVPFLLPVASRSRAPAFVWFRTKTDKGVVCLADHLHSVTQVVSSRIYREWDNPIYTKQGYIDSKFIYFSLKGSLDTKPLTIVIMNEMQEELLNFFKLG